MSYTWSCYVMLYWITQVKDWLSLACLNLRISVGLYCMSLRSRLGPACQHIFIHCHTYSTYEMIVNVCLFVEMFLAISAPGLEARSWSNDDGLQLGAAIESCSGRLQLLVFSSLHGLHEIKHVITIYLY